MGGADGDGASFVFADFDAFGICAEISVEGLYHGT